MSQSTQEITDSESVHCTPLTQQKCRILDHQNLQSLNWTHGMSFSALTHRNAHIQAQAVHWRHRKAIRSL